MDLHGDQQVTGAPTVWHTPPSHPEGLAASGSGGDPDGDWSAVERWHRDLGAKHRLGERDGHDHREVPTTAPEPSMGPNRHHHVEVAVRTAPAPLPPALQSNALAVVHPGGDAHPDLAWPTFSPRATAGSTGVFDPVASATACLAWSAERKGPLVLSLNTPATTRFTGRGSGPRAGTPPPASRTGHGTHQVHGGGHTIHCLKKRHG